QERGMAAPLIELLGSCFEDNADDRPRNAESLSEQIRNLLEGGARPVAVAAEPAPSSPPADLSLPRRVTNSIGMTLTLIPEGGFKMGSPASESDRGDDEGP